MVKKNGERGKAKDARERRGKLIKFIQKYGRWNVDRETWAKKEGVSVKSIDADLQWIKDNVVLDVIDEEEIKFEIHSGIKETLKQARLKAMSSDTERERRAWTNTYINLVDRFTKFLYDFTEKTTSDEIDVLRIALEALVEEEEYELAKKVRDRCRAAGLTTTQTQ